MTVRKAKPGSMDKNVGDTLGAGLRTGHKVLLPKRGVHLAMQHRFRPYIPPKVYRRTGG